MVTTRSRRLLLGVIGSVLALLVALAVTAELVVRARLDASLASLTEDLPGVDASPAGGLALWSLATGHVVVDVSLDDAALQSILVCRTGRDVSVTTSTAGIEAETAVELRGRSVPVHATLVPRAENGAWMLVPETVGVGGLTLPPQQLARLLGDSAPHWLGTGIPLPSAGGVSVTGVALADGAMRLSVATPIRGRDSAGDPFAELLCR